jgi:hypothetical protein
MNSEGQRVKKKKRVKEGVRKTRNRKTRKTKRNKENEEKRAKNKRNSNAPSPDTTGFSSLNTSTKSSSTLGGHVADNAIIGTLGYCVQRLCNLP